MRQSWNKECLSRPSKQARSRSTGKGIRIVRIWPIKVLEDNAIKKYTWALWVAWREKSPTVHTTLGCQVCCGFVQPPPRTHGDVARWCKLKNLCDIRGTSCLRECKLKPEITGVLGDQEGSMRTPQTSLRQQTLQFRQFWVLSTDTPKASEYSGAHRPAPQRVGSSHLESSECFFIPSLCVSSGTLLDCVPAEIDTVAAQ